MAFVATDKLPGVYIDEIQLPGPIPGVSTSNVAIVGPAESGPTNVPTLVTNPTQFTKKFGGYIYAPHVVQSTHAVHGFFRNGGVQCYFVRIGPAQAASEKIKDLADKVTLVVTAKKDGVGGNSINYKFEDSSIANTKVDMPRGTSTAASGVDSIVLDAVDGFKVGDVVTVAGKKDPSDEDVDESAKIKEIDAATKTIKFEAALTNKYKTGAIVQSRMVPVKLGTRLKLESIVGIEPGTGLKLEHDGKNEEVVVQSVSKATRIVTLESGLQNAYNDLSKEVKVSSLEFTFSVGPDEVFQNLSMDSRHSRHFSRVIDSLLVEVTEPEELNPTPAPKNRPKAMANPAALKGGKDDDIKSHKTNHYQDGINALEKIDEVNMLCVPDAATFDKDKTLEIHQWMIEHCEKMQERFAILDPPKTGNDPLAEIRAYRDKLQSDRGFAALYFPQIKISDPNPNFDRLIPVSPSGHIAGVYARTDNSKGVHKAPANEVINGVVELGHKFTDADGGILNELEINVLKFFRGRGFRIWGGRTLSTGTQWRYINVRRLMLFIEESIQEASEQFVFDPNNLSLWKTIERQVAGFLTGVWQNGALFGASPEQAFRVRIDEELNPPEARALGILTVEVIVFPTTPAEFIVFQVIQEPGGPRLVEI